MNKWAKKSGFTIVELMVIIAVVGILAGVSAVGYRGASDRARGSAVAEGLKSTADALELLAIKENRTTWWDDETITSQTAGHPPISLVIAETNLKRYLAVAPKVDGLNTAQWVYDNDGDTYNGCSTSSAGTNIYIESLNNATVATRVDEALDDGNLSCGKVRYDSTGRLIYSLSKTTAIE
jgi:Tfp pilus assembly protein PilE